MSVEEPYGTLIDSTIRICTWNVWGRFGPWEARETAIVETLRSAAPDVIALQESWVADGSSQAARIAERLGYAHWFCGATSVEFDGWAPVSAIVSRFPLVEPAHRPFEPPDGGRGWPGEAITCVVDGPRGEIPLAGVALDWPPHASALRQQGVRQVAAMCADVGDGRRYPVVVCGDFNASPDSAEMRALTGLDGTVRPGFVLFDAWDKEGDGDGVTWDRANPWAAPTLLPSRRIDYILTGWPSPEGGAGDVVHASTIGHGRGGETPPSDHYGVIADLRY